MRYMMLIYLDEQALSETEREQCYEESAQLARQLKSNGQYLATAPLHPTSTAISVRVRDGKPLVTDGPFAEAKEVLGGYWMIRVNSRAEAIEWARKCPAGDNEVIEIRQVQEMEDFPADVQKAAEGYKEMQAKASGGA